MKDNFNLKKITTPIIVHLLRQEMRWPMIFMLKSKLTVSTLKKSMAGKFPEDFLDLAALPVWVYINLKKKLGQNKAFEIMRIAILTAGVAKQNLLFATVKNGRDFKTFADTELEINKTGTTKWNTLEVIDRSDKRFEIKITRCLYHELAIAAGVPEMTPIVCQVDNAVFNSYMPEKMVFHRGGQNNRISDGSKQCHFIWELAKDSSTEVDL